MSEPLHHPPASAPATAPASDVKTGSDRSPRKPDLGPPVTGRWNLVAAFAGWFLPGLGHLLVGERNRGLILAVTITSIWLSGLLIGGISVVDRREHGFFFVVGQMWVAPSFVVDAYHTRLRESWVRRQQAGDDGPPLYEPALGKPEEIGSLYVTVAGLLNLLAIMDVLYREPR